MIESVYLLIKQQQLDKLGDFKLLGGHNDLAEIQQQIDQTSSAPIRKLAVVKAINLLSKVILPEMTQHCHNDGIHKIYTYYTNLQELYENHLASMKSEMTMLTSKKGKALVWENSAFDKKESKSLFSTHSTLINISDKNKSKVHSHLMDHYNLYQEIRKYIIEPSPFFTLLCQLKREKDPALSAILGARKNVQCNEQSVFLP